MAADPVSMSASPAATCNAVWVARCRDCRTATVVRTQPPIAESSERSPVVFAATSSYRPVLRLAGVTANRSVRARTPRINQRSDWSPFRSSSAARVAAATAWTTARTLACRPTAAARSSSVRASGCPASRSAIAPSRVAIARAGRLGPSTDEGAATESGAGRPP